MKYDIAKYSSLVELKIEICFEELRDREIKLEIESRSMQILNKDDLIAAYAIVSVLMYKLGFEFKMHQLFVHRITLLQKKGEEYSAKDGSILDGVKGVAKLTGISKISAVCVLMSKHIHSLLVYVIEERKVPEEVILEKLSDILNYLSFIEYYFDVEDYD